MIDEWGQVVFEDETAAESFRVDCSNVLGDLENVKDIEGLRDWGGRFCGVFKEDRSSSKSDTKENPPKV
jgi:hypothetical protein